MWYSAMVQCANEDEDFETDAAYTDHLFVRQIVPPKDSGNGCVCVCVCVCVLCVCDVCVHLSLFRRVRCTDDGPSSPKQLTSSTCVSP